MLIYGNINMQEKKAEQEARKKAKVKKLALKEKQKTFKERLFLHPEGRFLSVWDVFMLIIIGYSCFTSAYYIGFHMTENYYLLRIEDVTYVLFGLDILFNFFRMYQD